MRTTVITEAMRKRINIDNGVYIYTLLLCHSSA